ncbi:DUF2278 family protein [Pyxidicoccus parkwayensis]|uniref:DUF2278 family protein n=1 Tax=Pyxidicoccus parkwayensis TaxID=2813578 RepID=A0ABX7P162_9BACT|nr:DUF2278 family protein [Pyxidicoccus parkwaysis]QSQ24583.1 DUF2278 family protein [Pyxidicoccus parkwaysis]
MPLMNYGVLKGAAIDRKLGSGPSPHYQVHLVASGVHYRIAVNVSSKLPPSDLMYVVDENLQHPLTDALEALSDGLTTVPRASGGLALDFIRGNLFDRNAMTPLPPNIPGPDNDLNDKLDHYFQRAMLDPQARVYAFGESWGPETAADQYFGFKPGRGIHDIHMNQGNDPSFASQDGTWQDGGVFIHLPATQQWVGIFLKFQSQSWHTDDTTGHTIGAAPAPGPGPVVHDGVVRIIAALVNDTRSPEQETITLLNTSPDTVSLDGWKLVDRNKHMQSLSGDLPPGATKLTPVTKPMELSNNGGIISLLDAQGLKVDGVSYVKAQARPGWTVVF